MSYGAGASWEESESDTYTYEFTVGLTESVGVDFEGVEASVEASEEASTSVENTLETALSGEWTVECNSMECAGMLYQWKVSGSATDGSLQHVTNCYFTCVDDNIGATPKCPLGYCNSENCQCCNGHWNDGNDDDNYLAKEHGGKCKEGDDDDSNDQNND